MSDTTDTRTESGVQELIDRIRDKGVKAGQDTADGIVRGAKKQAAEIKAAAEAEAKALLEDARSTIASEERAAMDALRNAARDTVLELRARVRTKFESYVKQFVSDDTTDGEFLRSLVLVLAGRAADEFIKDSDAKIFLSSQVIDEGEKQRVDEHVRQAFLGTSVEMLREGVELIPSDDVHGGARVQLVGQDLEIDLTDEAISRMLIERILPRFRAMIERES